MEAASEQGFLSMIRTICCPICEEIFEKEIFQCPEGHSGCANCWNAWLRQKSSCPHCRAPVQQSSLVRNRQLESLVQELRERQVELLSASLSSSSSSSKFSSNSISGSSKAGSASTQTQTSKSGSFRRLALGGAAALRSSRSYSHLFLQCFKILFLLRLLLLSPSVVNFYTSNPSVPAHFVQIRKLYSAACETIDTTGVPTSNAKDNRALLNLDGHIPLGMLMQEMLHQLRVFGHRAGVVLFLLVDAVVWTACLGVYVLVVASHLILNAVFTVLAWLLGVVFRIVLVIIFFCYYTRGLWFALLLVPLQIAIGVAGFAFNVLSFIWSLALHMVA